VAQRGLRGYGKQRLQQEQRDDAGEKAHEGRNATLINNNLPYCFLRAFKTNFLTSSSLIAT
jgi:hypothetical protein